MNAGLPGISTVRDSLPGRPPATAVLMRSVMWALMPGTLLSVGLYGIGVLVNVLLGIGAALAAEALALRLRGRPVAPTLSDGSAVLAGWLLALCVTPSLPAWQLLLGVAIAVLLAKHVFGGIGHNPFNPAMVGYAVLLISFPQTMTAWPERVAAPLTGAASVAPSAGTSIERRGPADDALPPRRWDALTRQTPLPPPPPPPPRLANRPARPVGEPGGQRPGTAQHGSGRNGRNGRDERDERDEACRSARDAGRRGGW